MLDERVHAFTDDALGEHDAVALAALVRAGEVNPRELVAASAARAGHVGRALLPVAHDAHDRPQISRAGIGGPLWGVPTYLKDNVDLRGLPTGNGSAAYRARPARRNAPFTDQFLATGLAVLGKSRLPEFGLNASTEYAAAEPVRNPWLPSHSAGASSGGSAALVASGVVPIAHANDGGGSIRIPAAACGLVGLKPSRGRLVANEQSRRLPLDIVTDGVLTRSVRDTAAFFAAAERHHADPQLPPIGLVEGPSGRSLRIGLVVDSPIAETDGPTRRTVEETAARLAALGHRVEPTTLPFTAEFSRDFVSYWGYIAWAIAVSGRLLIDPGFRAGDLDGLTTGLRRRFQREYRRTPGVLRRLRAAEATYAGLFQRYDVILSPVLAHVTPPIGHLSPNLPFEDLIERLLRYVAFTPLNNVVGSPGLALPAGATEDGLPIGIHLSAAHGQERLLLELAFALEADRPWRRIQD
ncbi:amidase [Kitasatospora sp. MMS16-BH015]|uniref:amidase n=1 Tax=Kitasatospora sp. MMS16-BH015 TaxID=2018025 RepID=UPI000CA1FD90|nr:amidase [Kitasatospora sp. MMS16-BH015]AUG80155.1 amidase [Kitasatospora sp. MMS16-BH015]